MTKTKPSALASVRELASATPPERDRFIDFLRVAAICAVVLGHWLVIAVDRDGGENLLATERWMRPLTWIFQVMPLVFVVGGYSNAASWQSAQRRGVAWSSWFVSRTQRLLRPTVVFLIVTTLVAAFARAAGVDVASVEQAAWLVTIALWFLAVYLLKVALTPVTRRGHLRFGTRLIGVLVAGAALVDIASIGYGWGAARPLNWLLVWFALTQIGVAWQDGAFGRADGARLVTVAALALVALTTIGPYPVSMVNVPGQTIENASPPTLALLTLGLVQVGIALLIAPAMRRWLDDRRRWTPIVAASGVVMTIYLWHLVAVVIGAVLLRAHAFPDARVGSAAWWLLRPLWFGVLGLALVALIAMFSGAERRSRSRSPASPPFWSVVLAVPLLSAGLARFTTTGVAHPLFGWVLLGGGCLLVRGRRCR